MKITFKAYASLARHLPPEAELNAVEIEVAEDATVFDVIDRFRVPRPNAHLVLINGVYIEPDDRASRTFVPGDVLAVWPPVAGG